MSRINEALEKKVVEQALKGINVEELAKELAPELRKIFKQQCITYAKNGLDWDDILYASGIHDVAVKVMKQSLTKAIS